MKKSGLEIERKFLVRIPDIPPDAVRKRIEILQTYLVSGQDGSQRRVRRISENGIISYYYTEKIFYTSVTRKETEFEISESKYSELISQVNEAYSPIEKQRVCFEYSDQLFELDIYPFSDRLAIMEIELNDPDQEIIFPTYIDVVKEVTGIDSYSNGALANAGKFPDESDRCKTAEGVF